MINEKNVLDKIADLKQSMTDGNSDYLTGYICALSAVERMIAREPRMGEWIPCSERMPDEFLRAPDFIPRSDMVLVTDKYGYIAFDCTEIGEWDESDAIAWMPLPEPYQEEK